ncbi:hypothetical protein BDW67DRAFT_36387 [Aspergillus spinulosporus]
MLLPSALPCDMRRASRFTPSRLFSTPPPSDEDNRVRLPGNGLLGTCRALQSLLSSPGPSSRRTKPARLQSPLTFHPMPPSPASSRKSKRRSRSPPYNYKLLSPRPSRGPPKRRRGIFEEDMDVVVDGSSSTGCAFDSQNPSTPKRSRRLPYELPLGLSQTDFYSLQSPPITRSPPASATCQQEQKPSLMPSYDPDAALPSIENPVPKPDSEPSEPIPTDDSQWTSDDDDRLVKLVLEKFQLSQSDWDECARRMGKDHASVGQRWQVLVGEGNVGLRRGGRKVRKAIHEAWM